MKIFFFKGLFVAIICSAGFTVAYAQGTQLVSLKEKMHKLQLKDGFLNDTAYINTVIKIAFIYADRYPDSVFSLLKEIPEQSKKINYSKGTIDAYSALGNAYQTKGNFDQAMEYYNRALNLALKQNENKYWPGIKGNIALVYLNKGNYPVALKNFYASLKGAEGNHDSVLIRNNLNNIGTIHFYQGNMADAESAYIKTLKFSQDLLDTNNVILAYNNLGEVNLEQHDPHKALGNLSSAYQLALLKNTVYMQVAVANSLGDCYLLLDSLDKSATFFNTALTLAQKMGNARAVCKAHIGLAKVYTNKGEMQEALGHGLKGVQQARVMGQAQLLRDALEALANVYEKMGDGKNALKFYKEYKQYSDSLVNISSERAAANYKAEYEFSKKEEAFQRSSMKQRWMIFGALAASFFLLVILWIINTHKKRLDRSNHDLQHKNEIIEAQKEVAEETVAQLKAAQAQLIQAEKMASLGELTAGIAHEIQNPLNFVNNFSEVNKEMLAEMKEELRKGNLDEVKLIADDLEANHEKITHHGKRADAIVKGMLQHSRSSSGVKEPTDINALCEEYLRLSYQGFRAKDKSLSAGQPGFNATFKKDFDISIGKINIVPQDIGKVILNLLTNAFYAVDEKQKKNIQGYEPTVTVSTRLVIPPSPIGSGQAGGKIGVEIRIADNGNGIPQNVIDKIFQPFFTTKPTGQGTGLGLSLSYDIVKAHGGEIKVETNESEGTVFRILI
ncbi:MAG: tetratricopeptide repeat protein [Ferruginibacter sp.]